MESRIYAEASAPSYEEAIKCSTVPANQMNLPMPQPYQAQHMIQPMMMPMATAPIQPMLQPIIQPIIQPMIQPLMVTPSQPAPQMIQSKCNSKYIVIQKVRFLMILSELLAINIGSGGASPTCHSCQRTLRIRQGHAATLSTHFAFLVCCILG